MDMNPDRRSRAMERNYDRRPAGASSAGKGGLFSMQPHKSAGTALTITAASLIASATLGLITTSRLSKVTTSTSAQKSLHVVSRIAHILALGVGVLLLVRAGYHGYQHGVLTTDAAGGSKTDGHAAVSGWLLALGGGLTVVSAAVPMAMYQSYKKDKTIPAARAKEQKNMFHAQIAFLVIGSLSFIGSSGYVWTVSHQ